MALGLLCPEPRFADVSLAAKRLAATLLCCGMIGPSLGDGLPLHCRIVSIYDGDTLRAVCAGQRLKVRLYCIDAPEMEEEPWGRLSRDRLRSIAPEEVLLVPKATRYGYEDRYGRLVAEVLTADGAMENLNLSQVFSGHARVFGKYCYEDRYYWTEEVSKSLGAGIWSR